MPLIVDELDRGFVADRAVRSLLVVVSTPSLAFSARIVEAHEPMRIQAFRPELAVEGFDEGIVGWLAWAGEVERYTTLVRPQVQIARHELGPLSTRIAVGIRTGRPTLSSTSTTSAPRKLNRGSIAGEGRENVSMIVSTRSLRPVGMTSPEG